MSLMPAKTTPPRLTGVYPRERLFSRLDECGRFPLAWLAAPPGAGKTTLVASYLEDRARPALWYRLGPEDGDPASFFRFLHQAAQALPGEPSLPLLTPEYGAGMEIFARNFFRTLCAELPVGGVIVLDNFQELEEESPLLPLLAAGLEEVPPDRTALILSHHPPPPPFARARARRQMTRITRADMQLREEEAHGLAEALGYPDLDGPSLEGLYRQSDGWAAGLVLLLEQGNSPESGPARPELPQTLFDYFFGEIFEGAPEGDRRFLQETAELPYLEPSVIAELTGREELADMLKRLEGAYHFLQPLADKHGSYGYHPLFRPFLRSVNQRSLPVEELASLRQRAAAVLARAGDSEAAAELMREAGDWQGLADLIRREAPVLLTDGRHRTLEAWLSALPEHVREADPWLVLWLGACRAPFQPERAIAGLEQAYAELERHHDPAGLYLAWSEIVSAHAFYSGDLRPLDGWLDELEALRRRFPDFPSAEVELRVATSAVIALMWHRPDPKQVRAWEKRILEAVHSGPLVGPALMGTIQIGLYHAGLGRLDRTDTVLDLIRRRAAAPETPAFLRLGADFLEAVIAQYGPDAEAWARTAENGLQRGAEAGIRGLEPAFLTLAIYAHLHREDLPAAHRLLQHYGALADRCPPVDRARYHELRAWASLAEGAGAVALEQARLAERLMTKTGMPFCEAFIRLALAHAHGALGDYSRAEEEAERAHRLAEYMESPKLDQACQLGRAYIAHLRGDAPARSRALEKALRTGSRHGLYNSALSFPWILRPLLPVAVREGLFAEYACQIIRRRNFAPPEKGGTGKGWPWKLEIRALGAFEVLVHGEPIPDSEQGRRKPLLLLKALIAFGGQGVSDVRLAEALWPDAEGDAARRTFDTNLHRLRRLLGDSRALRLRNRTLSLDPGRVWVDVWTFEKTAEKARGLLDNPGGKGKALTLRSEALSLYRGPFLPDEPDASWAHARREVLRGKLASLLCELGDYLEGCGESQEAVQCYRSGVGLEPLAEELNRRLIEACENLGQLSEALQAYERFRQSLRDGLGATPSERITAAARRLRRNNPHAHPLSSPGKGST